MYRINELGRNVLIMTDEVIRHAPTKHTMDPRMIENSIIVAEERFIRPGLCHDYYEALIAEKNKEVTDANKAELQAQLDADLPEGSEAYTLETGDVLNSAAFLSPDNKVLWDQFLWKLIAECVVLLAYPEGFVQFGSSGVTHENPAAGPLNPGGVTTPELKSIRWVMDKKMQDRIDPLRESMHVWICRQKKADSSKYPLYDKFCDCSADGVAYKRKTDVVFGMYDDEEEGCCS